MREFSPLLEWRTGGPGCSLIMSEKLGQVKEWVSQVPSFTRFVLAASLPLSLLSILGFSIAWWFVNVPYYTIQGLQGKVYSVWRLLTTNFVLWRLFDLLTGLFFFAYTAEKAEWRLGTVRYIWYFLVNSKLHSALLIQVAFCVLMYVFAVLPIVRYSLEEPSLGLWPLVMVEAYVLYMKDMNDQVKPFGLLQVRALFVFVGISVVGVLAVWFWIWPLALGAGVGFLRNCNSGTTGKLDRLDLSKEKGAPQEDKVYCTWLKKLGHFVLSSEAGNQQSTAPAAPASSP